MSEPVLIAEGLVRRFDTFTAVDEVSLSVRSGEIHAIIGPNGAGKTTLFNLLTGNLRPHAGRILLEGRDVTGLAPFKLCRLGLGRTFQINNIFVDATVRQNIRLAAIAHAGITWNMFASVEQLLDVEVEESARLVGLEAQLDKRGATLAYGDRRRLELAIALACKPRILLLDEPTCGMSVEERPALIGLVQDIVRNEGVTAILIEHDMDIVFSVADRVMVMHHGQVIADDTPYAIENHSEVRRVYLGDEVVRA